MKSKRKTNRRVSRKNQLRILYFGVPIGALLLEQQGFSPVVAVIGPLDLPGRRRLRRKMPRSLLLGMPNLQTKSVQNVLRSADPDIILSFFWPSRIPPEILEMAPPYGCHPSLLPRLRGPDPYYWAIRNGETQTGVTLHELGKQYDTGAIVAKCTIPIHPEETSGSLAQKLDRSAIALLLNFVRLFAAGEEIFSTPQNEEEASYAPLPQGNDLTIDWHASTLSIERLVRAASPVPGAVALLGEQLVIVRKVRRFSGRIPFGLRPAEAWKEGKEWVVCTSDGALVLLELRDEESVPIEGDALFSRRSE